MARQVLRCLVGHAGSATGPDPEVKEAMSYGFLPNPACLPARFPEGIWGPAGRLVSCGLCAVPPRAVNVRAASRP